MISVGSRDGRKGLGLGVEMGETELEEGEAPCYHEDEESTMDPDIDLSYIEAKIQNVLGHFQKDFEGGVSAENLGAKFGGYGSFLPTYQRSPSWSHTRSPPEARNYDSPKSPRKLPLEDRRHNSLASSSASPSARPRAASGKTTSMGNSLAGDVDLSSKHAKQSNLKSGTVKEAINPSDLRTLKVRLKLGSENLPTQKNAEIYSGLGLVVSPSSSMDDSPATNEGLCGTALGIMQESPTSILEIMTSFPGDLRLSPLSDDLIYLTEKRKIRGKNEYITVNKARMQSSGLVANGSLSNTWNQRVPEKDDASFVELASKNSGGEDGTSSLLKKEKETDINSLGCEELVSNALRLPLLSSSRDTIADSASKDGVKAAVTERDSFDRESAQDSGRAEKLGGRSGSSTKISESKKGNVANSLADFPEQDVLKAENSNVSNQSGSNVSKGRKILDSEPTDLSKQSVCQNGGSGVGEGIKTDLEKSSTGGKKKQKSVLNIGAEGADIPKSQLTGDIYTSPKSGKSSHFVSKAHELHEKPGNRYKDFFGELEFEENDNESISGDIMTSPRMVKGSQVADKKGSNDDLNPSEEKLNVKTSTKSRPPDKYSRMGSRIVPPLGKGPNSEAPIMDPLVNEDWVQCEKCQKWRLLPLGTNPKSLPDKWLCRMLTWLPGMNRCSIPEDVTTNALRALYHPPPPAAAAAAPAPAVEGEQNQLKTSVVSSGGVRHSDQEHQTILSQTATTSGKKKHSATDLDSSSYSSNSRKKPSSSGNISSSNRGDPSPQDLGGYQQMRQSSSTVEKYDDDNKIDKRVSLVNSADKGTNIKGKTNWESDSDSYRASKRIKSNELHSGDENLNSDDGGASSRTIRAVGLSNNHKGSRDETVDPAAHLPGTSDDGLLHSNKLDDKDFTRIRKGKEYHDSHIQAEKFSSSGRRQRDSGDFVEEMCENDHQKEKKARVSKSGGKDSSRSKSNLGTDRQSRGLKDGQYLHNAQATDFMKSDVCAIQPPFAANSTSSKVSGSHRKSSSQEVKGSPVESVSSSPFRFSNPNSDKVTSAKKGAARKDDFHDSGSLSAANPITISSNEVGLNEQMVIVKNDSVLDVNGHDLGVHNGCLPQSNESAIEKPSSDQCQVEEKPNTNQSQNSGSHTKKSGKEASSHSKGTTRSSRSNLDKDKTKASDYSHDSFNPPQLYEEKSKNQRNKLDEKSNTPVEGDKFMFKKDTAGGTLGESSKGHNSKTIGGHTGLDSSKSQDKRRSHKQDHVEEKLKKKRDQDEVYRSGKSYALPPLARGQTELISSIQPEASHKENGVKVSGVEAFDNGETSKEPNQRKKAENQNCQTVSSKISTPSKIQDVKAPSPARRDSSSHAANSALKEAKDLKHLADRLKNSGSNDSMGFYFQAALKFLHGACLLESGSTEGTKQHDMMHAMHIYSSTAKLCEFCAHEYEKTKDMAAAALAYKCMEVAFMRVVYSSHSSASRDRNELQNALQIVPPGESPSSSASDVDNLNHQATIDKAAPAKVAGSPQVSGSHSVNSRNRTGFLRLLNFAQDVTYAMEASRKSRIALAAATSKLGDQHKDSISSLKKALDSHFQDVEGLLRLVRVAMETISC